MKKIILCFLVISIFMCLYSCDKEDVNSNTDDISAGDTLRIPHSSNEKIDDIISAYCEKYNANDFEDYYKNNIENLSDPFDLKNTQVSQKMYSIEFSEAFENKLFAYAAVDAISNMFGDSTDIDIITENNEIYFLYRSYEFPELFLKMKIDRTQCDYVIANKDRDFCFVISIAKAEKNGYAFEKINYDGEYDYPYTETEYIDYIEGECIDITVID